MAKKLFGTDGVRGVANAKLTPELAFQIGQSAGRRLSDLGQARRVAIGRDTRRSGPMLGAALGAGFCSVGVDVVALGVVPTGCISYLVRTGDYGLGAVISASHNPAPDNGIKLIGHDGRKVEDSFEEEVEALLGVAPDPRPTRGDVGYLETSREEVDRYVDYLVSLAPEGLSGLEVAVDGANGAAYAMGVDVLRRLGATVVATGDSPDGMNINEEGGATKPETIQRLTQESGATVGIAFDGDADRAVFSDDQGRLINGDRTMAIWAAARDLEPPVVVGTVMSNMGFERYLAGRGIRLERAAVGDKYVAAKLRELGGKVGGEQSGHLIFPELGPTGDGLITAIELLNTLKAAGRSAASFVADFDNTPQLLVNVEVAVKEGWDSAPRVLEAIGSAEEALAGRGRVNVRASGTQPMIRVMVEADDLALRDRHAEAIVSALLGEQGGRIYSQVDLTHALGD